MISKSAELEINALKKQLISIDAERSKIIKKIDEVIVIESIKNENKIIKLNKNKGFNWAYFKRFVFRYSDYSIYTQLFRDGHTLNRVMSEIEIGDEDFKNTPIGKKIPNG